MNVGFPSTAFGVYQPYIVEAPGMSHSLGSLVVSVRALVSLVATVLVARYYRRLDCRAGVVLGTCLTGLGFVVYAFANGFVLYVVGSVLAGLGYGLGGAVGMTLLVGRWFKDDVGKASGFAAMGSGMAGCLIPLAAVQIIAAAGLRASFLFEAAIAFAVALGVGLLLRNRPQDIGREPHTSGTVKVVEQRAASHGQRELSPAAHALLVVAIVGVGCGSGGGVAYISILMTSNGISELFAATLLSVVGLALVFGKFSVGAVMDALGNRCGSMIFFAVFVAGLLLCCCAALQNPVICVAAAVLYGFGASLGSTGVSVWSIEFSGTRNRARVARDFQCAYAAGGFAFNLLPGILYELSGTYVTAYALLALLIAASMVLVAVVYHCSRG
ncbi:MAG: nitrate/nitrite transporter [Coriobacteriales bacterium]